jgi:oligoendopeptidase F
MKFSEIVYKRPDLDEMKPAFISLLRAFRSAASAESQAEVIQSIYGHRAHFETMANVASIRHTIDTSNSFFEEEQDYFDNSYPIYLDLVTEFYKELLASDFRSELEKKYGKQLFEIARLTINTFSPAIIADLQLENELTTQYTKLIASAEIEFDGKKLNITGMVPYKLSPDRETRKLAHEKTDAFFAGQAPALDRILGNW